MDSLSMLSRLAVPEDATAIARVHVRSWQSTYRGIMPDELLDGLSIEQRTELWKQTFTEEGRIVLVLELDSEVIGFSLSFDKPSPTEPAMMVALYVLSEHWGKGAGWSLFQSTCQEVWKQGCAEMCLWVARENDRARAFYERAGMHHDGECKTQNFGGRAVETLRYCLSLRGAAEER